MSNSGLRVRDVGALGNADMPYTLSPDGLIRCRSLRAGQKSQQTRGVTKRTTIIASPAVLAAFAKISFAAVQPV